MLLLVTRPWIHKGRGRDSVPQGNAVLHEFILFFCSADCRVIERFLQSSKHPLCAEESQVQGQPVEVFCVFTTLSACEPHRDFPTPLPCSHPWNSGTSPALSRASFALCMGEKWEWGQTGCEDEGNQELLSGSVPQEQNPELSKPWNGIFLWREQP